VVGSIYSGQEPIISRRVFRHFTWLSLHARTRRVPGVARRGVNIQHTASNT
jgi:hypothetical protein